MNQSINFLESSFVLQIMPNSQENGQNEIIHFFAIFCAKISWKFQKKNHSKLKCGWDDKNQGALSLKKLPKNPFLQGKL
jgi:hypothetical protein